jgi:hypothetical protein
MRKRGWKVRRYLAAIVGVLALSGCGDSSGTGAAPDAKPEVKAKENSSNNPLDHTKAQIEWSNATKKEIKDSGKARADEIDKILDQRVKGK